MIAKSIIKRFFCLCQLCKVRRRLSEKVEWVQTLLKIGADGYRKTANFGDWRRAVVKTGMA